jgi:hypothetical protein
MLKANITRVVPQALFASQHKQNKPSFPAAIDGSRLVSVHSQWTALLYLIGVICFSSVSYNIHSKVRMVRDGISN